MAQIILIQKPPSAEQREARIIYLQNLSLPNLIQAPLQTLNQYRDQIVTYLPDQRLTQIQPLIRKQISIKESLNIPLHRICFLMSIVQLELLYNDMVAFEDQRLNHRIRVISRTSENLKNIETNKLAFKIQLIMLLLSISGLILVLCLSSWNDWTAKGIIIAFLVILAVVMIVCLWQEVKGIWRSYREAREGE